MCEVTCLTEYIPLQQGLRLIFSFPLFSSIKTHRVYSITTRIKTWMLRNALHCYSTHRVYSITTRIKTITLQSCLLHMISHRVYSITTRIKTLLSRVSTPCLSCPHRVYSITTRIKTLYKALCCSSIKNVSQSIFHYNKD